MATHTDLSNLIWDIANLLRGPYRPPQYERVMLPLVVLRRFDCVLADTKDAVVAEAKRRAGGKIDGDALDSKLNQVAGHRFHNHAPYDFKKLLGDPNDIRHHLIDYIKGFSKNVRDIFDYFEFTAEIERMDEAGILFLIIKEIAAVDLHPAKVKNGRLSPSHTELTQADEFA